MRDTAVFTKLLGLQKPWKVTRVSLTAEEHCIDVWIDHQRGVPFACPECNVLLPSYDHAHARSWRHLDHGDWFTRLHARIPRVTCLWHGIRHTPLPWALAGARYTIAFERHAIDVLRETDVLGGARLLYLSWDEAWHIMERAVSRGQQRKGRRIIPRLGVDEKAVAKGHCYVTVVCDLDQSTVEYVADNRRKISLDTYYRQLSPEQLAGIEAVAMDMWDPFIASTREHVPQGENKIVFDRYHIMKHVNEAVDAVRKWEHRRLQEEGDNTLTGSKHLWLFAEENLPEDWEEWFSQLRAQHLKTGRAWALKEALRVLWSYQRRGWAQRYWQRWYFWATHSQLPPMVDVARMLKVHLDNIMTYFAHRITNATSEGLNSKIQTVKKTLTATAIGTI